LLADRRRKLKTATGFRRSKIRGCQSGIDHFFSGGYRRAAFRSQRNRTNRDRLVRNLSAIFLALLATVQPAMCCCPEPELRSHNNCSACENGNVSQTIRCTCNCAGRSGGCGCEGHECAATQPKSAIRERSSHLSKHTVTAAFQPAANAPLPLVMNQYFADSTPSASLSKCRPHLLLGHLVI
jgi:hypothetical protein